MSSTPPDTTGTTKTVLIDVRVFDGHELTEPRSVLIDGPRIGTDADAQTAAADGVRVTDGRGAALFPGFIDAHLHLTGVADLERLREFGVTTALEMGIWPAARLAALRGLAGLPSVLSAGLPAIGPGGHHAHIPGFPTEGILTGADQAEQFVADRVADGSDFIKIVTEAPGPGMLDLATIQALVEAAHRHGRLTIAHAVSFGAFALSQQAGVDVVTHAPLDRPLDDDAVAAMLAAGRIAVPTLSMMEGVARSGLPGIDFAHAGASAGAMYRAGVPVLAGTDANSQPGVPAAIPHGESLHHELELLVAAGMSTLDAVRAATVLPAKYFGLTDRGLIEPGRRADLVLIDGDPLADIKASRSIRTVWLAGVEHQVAVG